MKTAISNSNLARIVAKAESDGFAVTLFPQKPSKPAKVLPPPKPDLDLCAHCGLELRLDENNRPPQFCQNCKTELYPAMFRSHRKGLCFCEDCEKTKKLELNK